MSLSDKRQRFHDINGKYIHGLGYKEIYIKEFIRLLKNIKGKNKIYIYREHLVQEIDKLAGDELI